MARIEKTVFMSYRRTNAPWALAVSQNLTHHGFDVFFDFNGIASGDFESVILENIRARAHFVVLLTPSALERCGEPGDWLRREIETALEIKRNIVPLMLEGFDFSSPTIANQLTGKLAALKSYNAHRVPVEYFEEAMERLRQRFLNIALDAVLHPASPAVQQVTKSQQAAVKTAPTVQEEELTAQQWFERGIDAADLDEQVRFYTKAIRLKPDYANAFVNRGAARHEKGDTEGALEDFNEAIRFQPGHAIAFYNRGIARRAKGDLEGGLEDYSEAIRLQPDYADAFYNRGNTRKDKGDLEGGLEDYSEAIRLQPDYADAFYNRGNARKDKGDLEGALEDYNEAIRLQPDDAIAWNNRGNARKAKGDLEGALEDYNEAIRIKPDDAITFYNRALLFHQKASYKAAIADFQKYLDLGGGVRDGDQEEVEKTIRDLTEQTEANRVQVKTHAKIQPQKKRRQKKR
jgi:tetratricopeptide (TPR) repeat protein